MGTDCPLRVLGLPDGATSDEIRRAFRSSARRHHPDLGGDRARFEDVRAAFESLRRSGRVTDKPNAPARPISADRQAATRYQTTNRYQTWLRDLDAAAALTPEMLVAAQPLRWSTPSARSAQPSDSARRFAELFERELAAVS